MYTQVKIVVVNQVCEAEGFNVELSWNKLTDAQRKVVLYGSEKIKVPFGKPSLESRLKWTGIKAKPWEEGYYTTHELKNIDVRIPKNQLTVVTGLSGSGKSTLV